MRNVSSYIRLRENGAGWKEFFVRRFFRIYPPYLAAVLLFSIAWPLFGFARSLPEPTQWTSHLLLIHNLSDETKFGINPSLWTIGVEFQLYAIYPLMILIVNRLGWARGMLMIASCEVCLRLLFSLASLSELEVPAFVRYSPFAYWLSWSIGAHLADCHVRERESVLRKISLPWIASACVLAPLFKPTESFGFLFFSLATGVLINSLLFSGRSIAMNSALHAFGRHLSFVGLVSYSFYLLHQPMLLLSQDFCQALFDHDFYEPVIAYPIALAFYAPILLMSGLFYKYVEVPAAKVGRIFGKQRPTETPAKLEADRSPARAKDT